MVELARGTDGRFALAYGGDTFNTAVYLARCGVAVDYLTRLGTDPYSDAITMLAQTEAVGTSLITRAAGRMPGLYLIETDGNGERTFHYWRDRSPARETFDAPLDAPRQQRVLEADVIFLSAISLSLYAADALDRLHALLAAAKANGARIAFDGNYRPRGWAGDAARARATTARFLALADIAFPTFDDEAALWSDIDPAATLARLIGAGIGEVAVKCGADGALVFADGATTHVQVPAAVTPVDTTGAGDSFDAAYLAHRLDGARAPEAALAGHRLAGEVIRHRGAIVPSAATAPVIAALRGK
jgi:2-dehydro-3-deoxygluconokinase